MIFGNSIFYELLAYVYKKLRKTVGLPTIHAYVHEKL